MDRIRDYAATRRTAGPAFKDEDLIVARTQYFRIVQPARAGGKDNEPIHRNVWPPLGSTAYNFEQTLGALQAFTQRWMDTGLWPPEELEPWAEPVTDVSKGLLLPTGDPAENAWTLRDYALARMSGLAVAANCKLPVWLNRRELHANMELSDLDHLLIRVLRSSLTPEDTDPHGFYTEET